MMKPKEIQELLDFIASSGLAEVTIETEQIKLNVKRNATDAAVVQTALPQVLQPTATSIPPTTTSMATEATTEQVATSKQTIIKSPMIGTFYRSSGPDTPMFVNIGDEIAPGKTLCIIEAMKLFNEIESEFSVYWRR